MADEIQKLHEAVRELRSEVEAKGGNLEKIDKINKALDAQEEKNQKLVAEIAERKKAEDELNERMAEVEAKYARAMSGVGIAANDEKALLKKRLGILGRCLAGTVDGLTMDDLKMAVQSEASAREIAASMGVKLLTTQSNIDGGFLIVPEVSLEIIKNITEISPFRSAVRVKRTRSKYYEQPRRENLVAGGWVGETRVANASNSKYSLEQIPMRKAVVFTPTTQEELTQTAYNVEAELMMDMVERFAQLEGEAIVRGDGVLQPQGFLTDPRLSIRNSGVANSITADAMTLLTGDIKVGYDPVFSFNRRTLAFLRTLKDGQGMYLWQPAFSNDAPSMILGHRYINAIDMDDIGAGKTPVAFGDFLQGYTLVDGVDVAVIRDVYTQATEGIVRFVWHKFQGGQVVKPEALKLLKCAVS